MLGIFFMQELKYFFVLSDVQFVESKYNCRTAMSTPSVNILDIHLRTLPSKPIRKLIVTFLPHLYSFRTCVHTHVACVCIYLYGSPVKCQSGGVGFLHISNRTLCRHERRENEGEEK